MNREDKTGEAKRMWGYLLIFLFSFVIFSAGCTSFERLQSVGALSSHGGDPRVNLLAVRQLRKTDCGVASLAGVISYWGEPVAQGEIKESLGKAPKGGYTLAQLQGYARKNGFDAFILHGSYDLLRRHCSLGRPCIIVLRKSRNRNHSLVVVDVIEEEGYRLIEVMDPATGKLSVIRFSKIDSRWEAKGRPVLLVGKKSRAG